MNAKVTVFYERRRTPLPINFTDRRKTQRRNSTEVASTEQRRLASQTRGYERKTFRVPVILHIDGKEVTGYTENVTQQGLAIAIADAILINRGISLTIRFSSGGNACYLNIGAQVAFCRNIQKDNLISTAIGISFQEIQEFGTAVLLSAVKTLSQNTKTHNKSLIAIYLNRNDQASRVADIYLKTKGLSKKSIIHKKNNINFHFDDLEKAMQDTSNGCQSPFSSSNERCRFTFNKTLYLTDTNVLGNAYFSRYFDWQGTAREEFLKQLTPDPLAFFRSGFKIFTVQAFMEYRHECYFYDEIEIEVKTTNIRRASLILIFIFRNKRTGQIIAQGGQKLAFADHKGRPTGIPAEMRKNMFKFQLTGSRLEPTFDNFVSS